MAEQQRSPPPPYTPAPSEYNKPPAYFAQAPPMETAVHVGGPAPNYPHQQQQPGWYPPAPQHQAGPYVGQPPNTTVIVTAQQPRPAAVQTVVLMGNCPSCRVGFLRNEFDICGILCAIIFFPVGILCCLCMMQKRCSHCGARF